MPRVLLIAALTLVVLPTLPHAADAPAQEPSAIVGRFLAYPTGPHSYRAHRHLDAAGGGLHASIEANTEYAPSSGLHYEVTSQQGSGIIRSHVLLPLLQQEQQLIARGDARTVALSPENYQFMESGPAGDGLARIALQPLRKERALINGELLVRPDDGQLVRLDGRLAKNPSFWTKRVDVVRLYERINGVLMPVSLESTAQLRLFGKSTLHMTYGYTAIDGHPVSETSTR